MTTNQDLDPCKIGNTLIQGFEFVNDEDGSPIPQAGNRYQFSMKQDPSQPDSEAAIFVEHTVPAGLDADSGLVTIRVEKSNTALLEADQYFYELHQVISSTPEDVVLTIFDGKQKMEN